MDLANGRRNASPTRKSHKPRRGGVSPPEKERVDGDNKSTCHPELVELFLSEERGKSAKRQSGLRDLVTNLGGFLNRCNIPSASHQDSLRDPCVAFAPWFCLFAYAQPAKLRLRSG